MVVITWFVFYLPSSDSSVEDESSPSKDKDTKLPKEVEKTIKAFVDEKRNTGNLYSDRVSLVGDGVVNNLQKLPITEPFSFAFF